MSRLISGVFIVLIILSLPVQARVVIEITEGTEGASPIAVIPFAWQGLAQSTPQDMAAIIASDLKRSGQFNSLPRDAMISRPSSGSEVNFKDWRALGVEHIVVGRVTELGADSYQVQVQLLDVVRATQLVGYSFPASKSLLRRLAHQISDLIYEKLTGVPGAFNTRIAYITATGVQRNRLYELYVADSDGYNPQSILRSPHPIMSPAWSPDGQKLAYVSFERKQPRIFIQELRTGKRSKLPRYKGINGAPAWSPDGKRLVVTLSQNGNPDLYLYDLPTKRLTQLTRNTAIDTEAAWSPDGKTLVFTSDRSGRPQLYRIPVAGGKPERLTYEGKYNARARFSPDGKQVVFVHEQDKQYRIAVLELGSGILRVLTKGRLDESPSFAPNGAMILYATEYRGRGILTAVSADGRSQHRLVSQEGDVREPAWAPIKRR